MRISLTAVISIVTAVGGLLSSSKAKAETASGGIEEVVAIARRREETCQGLGLWVLR